MFLDLGEDLSVEDAVAKDERSFFSNLQAISLTQKILHSRLQVASVLEERVIE